MIGGAGFIGARLCATLTDLGVAVLPVTRGDPLPTTAELRAAGTVFMVAGSVTPLTAQQDPGRCAEDLAGLRRLLDRVGDPDGAPHVVLTSSGGTCYDPDSPPPYRETDPVRATTAYAALKLDQERLVAESGLPATVLRLANLYGRGQRAGTGQGVIAHWLDAVGRGEPLPVYGSLDTVRDYLYLDDLMDLLVRLHRSGPVAPVLNVGSGAPTALRDVARLITAATGCAEPALDHAAARPVDRQRFWLDVGLARAALGWLPMTPLAQGIRLTCTALARP
ncbi:MULTISPECIES: NAD-dependent epimerase/dehydratase family protein [Actinokineospora]|uniref:NAD-dependent epimerase/dehydratase family protein n=1 Tax=Actinokineospora TaxID=39845 RepID=UPI00166F8264|nr:MULTISPECIES: NAD-dependent epimerase/dehydratase family protein [Actinokineospora]